MHELINVRELLAFPGGDNSSDTVIAGIHWNLTTLQHWNYTYYSNGTFSNGSRCLLIFEPYTPVLLQNGTFLNSTTCYSAIEPIKTRGAIGIFFASFFAASIMFTFINLRKHGRMFLPQEKRFHAIGRRWQWYWMLATAAFGMISGISGIDVDRYYLPELPIVLANFFWVLMLPTTMAVVWESVRHWGSWQERQMVDPDPFILRQDDKRSKVEFYLPLIFYLFAFLDFFMVVPRSWGAIEKQRSPDQQHAIAERAATDVRFKAGAFFLFVSWLTVVFSLRHSIKHYLPRNRGPLNRLAGFIRYAPFKFILILPLSLLMIGYFTACVFDFGISPLKLDTELGYMYGLGWAPIAAIFIVMEVYGYIDPNEDKELLRQRRIRGAEIDAELGIIKKPHWWRLLNYPNQNLSVHEQIARNVGEIGGGMATTRNVHSNIEMGNMPVSKKHGSGKNNDLTAVRIAADLLFPTGASAAKQEGGAINDDRFTDTPVRGRSATIENSSGSGLRPPTSERSGSTNSAATLTGVPPQKVRSMLDV
ncbi:hypothetical protein B7463_g4083, partial [Scytalidium lignicola]